MTRKERKKPVNRNVFMITKGKLIPQLQPPHVKTMKIINQNNAPQHYRPTDFKDTSTDSCDLQIEEGSVTKQLILDPSDSSDIHQDYLEDNIRLTNPTEIKNGVDSYQRDNPEQELMKIDTVTEDPNGFNSQ